MKKQLKIIAVSVLMTALLIGGAVVTLAETGSRFSDKEALSYLENKRAIHLSGNTIYIQNQKCKLTKDTILKNDVFLISETDFETFFGDNVSRFGKRISIGSNVVMTLDSKQCSIKNISKTLTQSPIVVDGVLYIPFDDYIRVTDYEGIIDDNHGMYVTGTENDGSKALREANLYMFFERESAQTLKEKLFKNTKNATKHPRIIADSNDFNCIASEIKSDLLKKQWYQKVLYTANSIVKEPVLEYKISNGRLLDVANGALLRMQYLGFAYQITKNTDYSKRGIEELKAICSFKDWNPQHYLDTGTLANAAAIGYDWLYGAMTADEKRDIAVELQKKALDTALEAYNGVADFNDFWCESDTNWNIICNGGIANLALATAEYNTDKAMNALENALRSMEYAWYRFAPDGAWHEGPDYWAYQLEHLGLFMSAYEKTMSEAFAKNYPGLDKYAYFNTHFTGPDGLSNNFHDSDALTVQSYGQFYLAKLFEDKALMEYRAASIKENNIKPSVLDIIWCDAGVEGNLSGINVELDKYFGETEFVSMRSGFEKGDTWVSFHGGSLNNAHDHIDSGTFVFCSDGVRWAIDIGKENLSYLPDSENPSILAGYNSKYFYRRKGEGHNVVVINPQKGLEMDLNSFSKATKPISGIDNAFSSVDLTQAYGDMVSRYVRGYRLDNKRNVLTIRDEIMLNDTSELHWFMHTKGTIEIIDNNSAFIHQDGKTLYMKFISNADSVALKSAEAVPMKHTPVFENTPNTGISKIDYQLNGSGKLDITVCMYVLDDICEDWEIEDTPIDEWRVDFENKDISAWDDKITLYVDGKSSNKLSKGKLCAKINAYAPEESPFYGNLLLAVYRNGVLERVISDGREILKKTTLSVDTVLEDIENVTVKAMFWDKNMRPFVATEKYIKER